MPTLTRHQAGCRALARGAQPPRRAQGRAQEGCAAATHCSGCDEPLHALPEPLGDARSTGWAGLRAVSLGCVCRMQLSSGKPLREVSGAGRPSGPHASCACSKASLPAALRNPTTLGSVRWTVSCSHRPSPARVFKPRRPSSTLQPLHAPPARQSSCGSCEDRAAARQLQLAPSQQQEHRRRRRRRSKQSHGPEVARRLLQAARQRPGRQGCQHHSSCRRSGWRRCSAASSRGGRGRAAAAAGRHSRWRRQCRGCACSTGRRAAAHAGGRQPQRGAGKAGRLWWRVGDVLPAGPSLFAATIGHVWSMCLPLSRTPAHRQAAPPPTNALIRCPGGDPGGAVWRAAAPGGPPH